MVNTDNHFDEGTLQRIFNAEQKVKKLRKKVNCFFVALMLAIIGLYFKK